MFDNIKKLKIDRFDLDNGLKVLVAQKTNIPIASINLAYKVGSKDEILGQTGFAHLFEHLMFEGTENIKKGDFDKICSQAGGTNNAYTTYDWTAYTMTLPANQIELGFWLESDRMHNFKVTEDALRNQQSVVKEEILQTVQNSPYGRWRNKQAEIAFSDKCSYSWEVQGRVEDVVSSTLANTVTFRDKYYQPHNACLTVCGDVDPIEVYELVKKYFSSQNLKSPIKRNLFKDSFLLKEGHVSFEDMVPLSAVFLSFHTDSFNNDSMIYPAELLATILSAGRSSKMYNELVYKKQIASQTGCFLDKREYSSLFTFYAIANEPSIEPKQLYDAIWELIANLTITNDEIFKARNLLTNAASLQIQRAAGIADMISNIVLFRDDHKIFYRVLDNYFDVSESDIQRFIDKTFLHENSVRVDVLPISS